MSQRLDAPIGRLPALLVQLTMLAIAVVVAAVMLAVSSLPASAQNPTGCNDSLSNGHAQTVLEHAAGLTVGTTSCQVIDLNNDGDTDALDALLIAQCVAGFDHQWCSWPLVTDVETYGSPGTANGVLASDRYEVTVRQNGVDHDSHVHLSQNNHTRSIGNDVAEVPLTTAEREARFETDANHWTSFGFQEPVEVRVELANGSPGSVEVRPRSANINAQVSGGVVSFTITEPGQYAVLVGGLEREPLFVFADDLDLNKPDPAASNVYTPEQVRANPSVLGGNSVLYFAPGLHTISEPVLTGAGTIDIAATEQNAFPTIPSNTTVYLDGGAYVKGLLAIAPNVANVHVRGAGVLSGVDYPHQAQGWANHVVWFEGFSGSSNISLEGITIVDLPKTCVLGRSGALVVDNIKCLAWHANSDGITTGAGGRVTNSFFKVFDDVVKLFHSDVTVEGLTVWHQRSGSVFQLSWNISGSIGDSTVTNIDVIAVERADGRLEQTAGSASDYPNGDRANGGINNALINARNLKGGTISDIVVSDVRYDAQPFQLMQLQLKDHRTGFDTGVGNLDDIVLQNVTMPTAPRVESYVLDNGVGEITNIVQQQIFVGGSELTDYLVTEVTNPN